MSTDESSLFSFSAQGFSLFDGQWEILSNNSLDVHVYYCSLDNEYRVVAWDSETDDVIINSYLSVDCKWVTVSQTFSWLSNDALDVYGFSFDTQEINAFATKRMRSVLDIITESTISVEEVEKTEKFANAVSVEVPQDSDGENAAPLSSRVKIAAMRASFRHNSRSGGSETSLFQRVNSRRSNQELLFETHSPQFASTGGPQRNGSRSKNSPIMRLNSSPSRRVWKKRSQFRGLIARSKTISDSLAAPVAAESSPISKPYDLQHVSAVRFDPEWCCFVNVPIGMEEQFNRQFGVPLHQVPTTVVEGYEKPIPSILVMLSRLLINGGGLDCEGIFRLAPDKQARNIAIEAINRGTFRGGDGDVNTYANLIKVFFRDLPEGLLNIVSDEEILQVAEEGGLRVVERFMFSLPPSTKSIFLWLLDLMTKVAANHSINRMKPRALSIVIAPNLYKPAPGANPVEMMQFSGKVVRFLIECLNWRIAKNTN
eukprot:g5204.t1